MTVGILEVVESFYKNLFQKRKLEQRCIDKILDTVSARLSEEDKQTCDDDITIEEIKTAIKQMKPNKMLWSRFL